MIPILFGSKETRFVTNGICRLRDVLSCRTVEERNSIFECDFEYPVDGWKFDEIRCGRIIYATHDDSGVPQPFEIVSYTRPLNGVVSFHAVHISYKQRGFTVTGKNVNSLAQAFQLFESITNPFTYESDFTSVGFMSSADGTPRSIRQMLGGIEGSVLDAYGGEYEWDKFRVILHRSRGVERDFAIRYGVNLLNYNEEMDYSSAFTSCIPYWSGQDSAGKKTVVVASKVVSGNASYNGKEICVPLDLTEKFENKPTKTQLRTMAKSYMKTHQSYLPAQTIEVDFVRLSELGEYDELKELMKYGLCDTIRVVFPRYNMEGKFKIVKTEWDVLANRYVGMELGTLSVSLSEALGIGQDTPTERQVIPELTEDKITQDIASSSSFGDTNVTLTLTAGLYLLIGSAGFGANATGSRGLRWYVGSSDAQWRLSSVTQPAMASFASRLQTTRLVRVDTDTTVKLQVYQNSGATLSTDISYSFARIG